MREISLFLTASQKFGCTYFPMQLNFLPISTVGFNVVKK